MEGVWPFGRLGDQRKGEIELVREGLDNPDRWKFRNSWFALRDDSVVFPGGTLGSYLSLHTGSGSCIGGVAMLPVYGDHLLLCRNYRHGPRRWEIEIPRGFVDGGEDSIVAAKRELEEEYGVTAARVIALGKVNPDTGLYAYDVECFLCELSNEPNEVGEQHKSTAIRWTIPQTMDALAAGELRDGFLTFALLTAIAKRLLPI